MFFVIETKWFPKVMVRFNSDTIENAHVNEFVKQLNALYERKERFSMLFDTEGLSLGRSEIGFARTISHWINENRTLAEKYLDGTGVYITNPFVRWFVQLITKVSPPAAPLKISGKKEELYVWLGWYQKSKDDCKT